MTRLRIFRDGGRLAGKFCLWPMKRVGSDCCAHRWRSDVIVDAMFGTGFRGVASGAIGRAIRDVNEKSKDATAVRPALILAVDTPSGLPSDGEAGEEPILKAHHTVTFTAPKVGQLISRNSAAVGSLRVVNIGSPVELVEEIGKSAVRWSDAGEFVGYAAGAEERWAQGAVRKYFDCGGIAGEKRRGGDVGKRGALGGSGIGDGGDAGCCVADCGGGASGIYDGSAGVDEGWNDWRICSTSTCRSRAEFYEELHGSIHATKEAKTVLAIGPGLGQHEETQEFVRSMVKTTRICRRFLMRMG